MILKVEKVMIERLEIRLFKLFVKLIVLEKLIN